MSELRWILLAAGLLLLAVLYWQGRRQRLSAADRARVGTPPANDGQVRGPSEAPIPTQTPVSDDLPEVRVHDSAIAPGLNMDQALSTAALQRLTITQPLATGAQAATSSAIGDEARASRKIVVLRVPAIARRLSGARLRELLIEQGLRHGRYGIFHRHDVQGATLFSVASLVEPGTFDLSSMSDSEYPGVSLFMQLPGPPDARAAFEMMLACAQVIRREFAAGLQSERGKALDQDTLARLRADIAAFERQMPKT